MAKYTTENPEFRGIAGRKWEHNLPEEGSIFFTGGTNEKFGDRGFNSSLYTIKNGALQQINPEKYMQESELGKRLAGGSELRNMFGGNDYVGSKATDPKNVQASKDFVLKNLPNGQEFWDYLENTGIGNSGAKMADTPYARGLQEWYNTWIQKETGINPGTLKTSGDWSKLGYETLAKDMGIDFKNVDTYLPETLQHLQTQGISAPQQTTDISSFAGAKTGTGQTAKLPTETITGEGAKDYKEAGYDPASTMGTRDEGTVTAAGVQETPSGVKYGEALTLESGQTISPDDPNYATYAKQMGIEKTSQYSDTYLKGSDDYFTEYVKEYDDAGKKEIEDILDARTEPLTEEQAKKIAEATGLEDYTLILGKTPDQMFEERAKIREEQGYKNTGGDRKDVQYGEFTGQVPGYKGVYEGKEKLSLNDAAVNELFKQYHNRDANLEELNYWRAKEVGHLEDTLAKTAIFEGEDADKIRAQMMDQGQTYIRNQAELEALAQAGQLSPETLTNITDQASMMFRPEDTTTGATGQPGQPGPAGDGTAGDGTEGEGTDGTTGGEGDLIDTIADAVGDPNASEVDILNALGELKKTQTDPYYSQLIAQAQMDVTGSINRMYEDRIRQLQSESFNLAENIRGAQKGLEASGMTFSGDAIRQLGTLAAFGQGTAEGLAPAQLGQEGQQVIGGQVVSAPQYGQLPVDPGTFPGQMPTQPGQMPVLTPEQMGIEGSVNMKNRLFSESSRAGFNRGLEDIGQKALRYLGTQGVAGMGLPAQALAGQPQTTGTMQYDYNKALQDLYSGVEGQEGTLTKYQQGFL